MKDSSNRYSCKHLFFKIFLLTFVTVVPAPGKSDASSSSLYLHKLAYSVYGSELLYEHFTEFPSLAGTSAYSGYSPGDEIHFSKPQEETKKFFRLSSPASGPSKNTPPPAGASRRDK
jgi:hypothetical protein